MAKRLETLSFKTRVRYWSPVCRGPWITRVENKRPNFKRGWERIPAIISNYRQKRKTWKIGRLFILSKSAKENMNCFLWTLLQSCNQWVEARAKQELGRRHVTPKQWFTTWRGLHPRVKSSNARRVGYGVSTGTPQGMTLSCEEQGKGHTWGEALSYTVKTDRQAYLRALSRHSLDRFTDSMSLHVLAASK